MDTERVGRLNTTTPINETTIRKVATVIEPERPIRLGIEAWALSVAKSQGLDVPTVYEYTCDENGRETLEMEMIPGVALEHVPDYKTRAKAMHEVGKQLGMLVGASPSFGWVHLETHEGSHTSWRQFLVDYVDRFASILARTGLMTFEHVQKVRRMTEELEEMPEKASLVHRDIKPGNLILRPDNRVAIIDWENTILGDSTYDVALYEIREGRSLASLEFARGSNVDPESVRHKLYGAIALIGIVDYERAYGGDSANQAARLGEYVELL